MNALRGIQRTKMNKIRKGNKKGHVFISVVLENFENFQNSSVVINIKKSGTSTVF